jgi:hypothetical protein
MEAQLPDELLTIIFEDMPQQTLRDARLVNSQWNAVSTPLVFERIHASLLSWSLVKLSALSQSLLARHVKTIDFHTEQLLDSSRYLSLFRTRIISLWPLWQLQAHDHPATKVKT